MKFYESPEVLQERIRLTQKKLLAEEQSHNLEKNDVRENITGFFRRTVSFSKHTGKSRPLYGRLSASSNWQRKVWMRHA